jgi:hypothetical protein
MNLTSLGSKKEVTVPRSGRTYRRVRRERRDEKRLANHHISHGGYAVWTGLASRSQTLKHNTNLVISPEFPPGSPPDLCNHIPGHASSFHFLAQANYPEPTGTSRSIVTQSQRPKLSTNKIPFRFPFEQSHHADFCRWPLRGTPLRTEAPRNTVFQSTGTLGFLEIHSCA